MFNRLKESLTRFKSDVDGEEVAETPDDSSREAEVEETVDTGETADTTESDDSTASELEAGTRTVGFGTKAKSVVTGRRILYEDDLEEPLEELRLALLSANVEYEVTEAILSHLRDELVGATQSLTDETVNTVDDALRTALLHVLTAEQFDFEAHVSASEKPLTIVFTGVNGVGKTTTIAKLHRYFEQQGLSTVWANGDTYRAGANEQIQTHADALGAKLITHQQGGDPTAVVYDAVEYADAHDIDVVLGDTAGRLHNDTGLMAQLEKLDRVVGPDMTIFVDEAVAGQDAVNRASEFGRATDADAAILTMAEADDKGGAAISIAHATGIPIAFLGTGQGYDDLTRFDPEELVNTLLSEG